MKQESFSTKNEIIFYVERFTGFKDKRSFLLFLKQFFNAILNDEKISFKEVLKVLYQYLTKEVQIYYESFRVKRNDLRFICAGLTKIYSPPDDYKRIAEVVDSFIKIGKRRQNNNLFCFPIKASKNTITIEHPLYINSITVVDNQSRSTFSSSTNSNGNVKQSSCMKGDRPSKNNAFKIAAVPAIVGAKLPKFAVQNYKAIKEECLKNGKLFEDPYFSTNKAYCYCDPQKKVEWRRPGEIVENPLFCKDGFSRFDVVQGELGDCWVLAALATVTLNQELFNKVVDPNQSFTENYVGIFHFKFWRYGAFIDIVIDDRLPTHDGKLMYMCSSESDEFWGALLEKAYAKLYGSYEALDGGWESEALEDMTGGLAEIINIKNFSQQDLLKKIFRGTELQSMFCCSKNEAKTNSEAQLPNGLMNLHAYSITGINIVKGKNGPIPLIRIRNPHGEAEWTGDYSDDCPMWDVISFRTKQKIEYKSEEDGEFFMSFADFQKEFKTLEICHIGPEIMQKTHEESSSCNDEAWSVKTFHGVWRRVNSVGGSTKYLKTFSTNPQYFINLKDSHGHEKVTVIIGLLQKYRRELKPEGVKNLPIKFALYKVEDVAERKMDKKFFAKAKPIFESKVTHLREVTSRLQIPPGEYLIIPSTDIKCNENGTWNESWWHENDKGNFMLRIFTDGIVETRELL